MDATFNAETASYNQKTAQSNIDLCLMREGCKYQFVIMQTLEWFLIWDINLIQLRNKKQSAEVGTTQEIGTLNTITKSFQKLCMVKSIISIQTIICLTPHEYFFLATECSHGFYAVKLWKAVFLVVQKIKVDAESSGEHRDHEPFI